MSAFRSCIDFLLSNSPPKLTVRFRLEQQLALNCRVAMCYSDSRQLLCDNFECLRETVLCQLPIGKHYSFLSTNACCHYRSFQNTLVLTVASSVVGCHPYCSMTRRSIYKHFGLPLICFLSVSLLAQ